MNNKKIITENAPLPIGPYSQAIEYNGFLFISGQIAIDPRTGKLVNDNIIDETKLVMKNISAILSEASISFDNVIKASIFLKDMENFKLVNEVYGSFFKNNYFPARECMEVSKLPKNVNVEISVIASR